MERIQVTSSNVLSIGYDPNTLILEIEFKNGSIYHYYDLPLHEYETIIRSESVGTYLNQVIKNNYRYSKI